MIKCLKEFWIQNAILFFLFSVKNHFSHFTLEMEKLSFWVEKRTSELRKWQIDRQQDNFSFLRLTLFAFGFQEIIPNFRWPEPQSHILGPFKIGPTKITLFEYYSKCLIGISFWHFPPISVLIKLTCLVTLFDCKFWVFKIDHCWWIFVY